MKIEISKLEKTNKNYYFTVDHFYKSIVECSNNLEESKEKRKKYIVETLKIVIKSSKSLSENKKDSKDLLNIVSNFEDNRSISFDLSEFKIKQGE